MPVMNMRLLAHGPELRPRLAPVCLLTAGKNRADSVVRFDDSIAGRLAGQPALPSAGLGALAQME